MTKGGSGKPKMLGRLIFGEKRKQNASPSRHRSTTQNGSNVADVSSPGGAANRNPINVHDWAVWRMQLNEQMGNGMIDPTDLKQMRQFLHSNSFYQQHSRDPSNGRYNGVRLLFSIPHAKIKPESNDRSRKGLHKNTNLDEEDTTICDQSNIHPNIDDRTITSVNSVTVEPSIITDKTISQLLPKNLIGNIGGFLQTNEQMVAADASQTRRSMRASYTASDRVHSTLQKAVKDGNVLEKIKAFEMQAAAAQAVSTPKLGSSVGITINNRMQSVASTIQSAAHRTLSPAIVRSISPMPIQHESQQQQQQYIRSHRNRYVHPVQHHHDGHLGPMIGRESRKGAHVLEPVHGDIILKRRTPSQRTVNDEDYSMTAISSMAVTASQGHHHHRHHHYHHRASASRSRHRQESVHDKRSSSHHDNAHKKHQQKQKETTSSSNKTNTRRRWLKGRKETPTEPTSENGKQEVSTTKSSKNNKNKKKNNQKEKVESSKKATSPDLKEKITLTSDTNHVYDTSNISINEQKKTEPTSPQPPSSRIEEENESDREEKTIENKTDPTSTKEEEIIQHKGYDIKFERRPSKTKYHQKFSSTDGEILNKVEDDTRFSRPTDDHAHRSELNDEEDEYKSEGDVFIEESYVTNTNPQQQQQQSSNVIQRHSSQCSIEELPSDRRWQWSKESGGLIEKGHPKKKQQQPITIITRKNKTNDDREQIVYETPSSEQIRTPILKKTQSPNIIIPLGNNDESNNNKQFSKQILYAIMNSKNKNPEQTTTDEFFENGPHTNPEETTANITSSA